MTDITLTISRSDLLILALTVSNAARASENDERLSTAASEYRLSATIWRAAGYQRRGDEAMLMAQTCLDAARTAHPERFPLKLTLEPLPQADLLKLVRGEA